jgi:hypothetical protein
MARRLKRRMNMAEVKYDPNCEAGSTPEQRIASRLRNSGDTKHADHVVQKGDGPTRAFTNIHHSGSQQHVKPSAGHTVPTPKADNRGRFPEAEDR